MPVVDGKIVRSRFTSLSLKELSSVDNPAQPGAVATILKRHDPNALPAPTGKASWLARQVAKYVDEDDGAHTFQEVLTANDFDEKIWPMVSALSQSIRSIMGDATLKAGDKQTKVQASVDQFLAAMRELDPATDSTGETPAETVEKALRAIIATPKKKEPIMKTVAELEAEITTLKGQLTAAQGEATTAKSALETEQTAHATTKAALVAATDETITVGGQELKKSTVGDASFSVAKAMRDERDTAVFEKRATEEFGHLPGTPAEKAQVIKAVESHPDEATRKAALAIFTAAEKMAAGGFERLGSGGESPTTKAAQVSFAEKVAEIEKRDTIPNHEAMSKARREHPDLYQQAYEA